MPTRILLATDFSDASEEAGRQAHAIAARDHAILGLVHAIPAPMPADAQIPAWLASQVPNSVEMGRRAREAVEKKRGDLSTGGVTVELFVEEGEGHTAIVKLAETFGADLLVVGSHGRTGLARLVLGSVAERVVREAPCPVLVARSSPAAGPVVTATDFSEASKRGLRAAALEASRTGSPLVALHVFDLGWPGATAFAVDASGLSASLSDSEALRKANEDLKAIVDEATKGLAVQATCEVLVGEPASTIVRRAEEVGARLVAVSTHGRTGLARMVLGSVAERVVRLAHSSVLAVHGAKS